MKAIFHLFIFINVFLCNQANAISLPVAPFSRPAFNDSSLKAVPNTMQSTVQEKKGFFGRLKQKMVAFVVKQPLYTKGKTSIKAILGWIGLGMVTLGLVLLFASITGTATAVLFFGGLFVALVSLLIPRSKEEKVQKKKGSKVGLIALGLGVAFVVAIAIAFSGLGHR